MGECDVSVVIDALGAPSASDWVSTACALVSLAVIDALGKLSASDWVSIVCAFVSLAATVVIAGLQHRQDRRMEEFEHRQDQRDEQRRADDVKARAVSFVSAHYDEKPLIPLCAVAAMHDELLHYSRGIYREFCCPTTEVQNLVLRYCGLDLRVEKTDGLFDECVERLNGVVKKSFQGDESPFYEGGKYLLHGLVRYGRARCR